jgi:hypothetical protein
MTQHTIREAPAQYRGCVAWTANSFLSLMLSIIEHLHPLMLPYLAFRL